MRRVTDTQSPVRLVRPSKDTHAWFIRFANVDDPEIAVSVIVEEGGSGGSVAAPVARAVFDAYYEAKNS